jgi:hypothetical protein
VDVAAGTTVNLPAATPLHAASVGAGAEAVSQSDVDAIVAAALSRFAAAGLSDSALSDLTSVQVSVGDLGGTYLGLAGGNVVRIDDDAAGNGWFVDATPLDDVEFDTTDSGTQARATSGLALGRTDLLTVVMHELGHHLGLADLDPNSVSDNLMTGILENATRRTAGNIDALFSAQDILGDLDN